jgi:hypothetical protein
MLRDVVSVQALPEHRIRVKFDDGIEGIPCEPRATDDYPEARGGQTPL